MLLSCPVIWPANNMDALLAGPLPLHGNPGCDFTHADPSGRGQRRGFAAARLVGLRFRIQPECCVLSGRGLCDGLRSPTECWVLCVIKCNSNPLNLQWVGRRGQAKKEEGNNERKRARTSPTIQGVS
jgi:hypothetical protein